MLLSVVIPARNESRNLPPTLRSLHQTLRQAEIEHEIVVVDDGSTDDTADILKSLGEEIPTLRPITNPPPHGFGLAVRAGLRAFKGDAVAIMMADASDRPRDLVAFFREFERTGGDCVFGTRFSPESRVTDYPPHKLVLNRLVNKFIQVLFGIPYNDTTNAFKLYSREAVEGLQPLISSHFNLTVELPLKAIIRGYRYSVVPNDWLGRTYGTSKLKIKEMGSRYLFIILYCFIEKWLSCGDYFRGRRQAIVK